MTSPAEQEPRCLCPHGENQNILKSGRDRRGALIYRWGTSSGSGSAASLASGSDSAWSSKRIVSAFNSTAKALMVAGLVSYLSRKKVGGRFSTATGVRRQKHGSVLVSVWRTVVTRFGRREENFGSWCSVGIVRFRTSITGSPPNKSYVDAGGVNI